MVQSYCIEQYFELELTSWEHFPINNMRDITGFSNNSIAR